MNITVFKTFTLAAVAVGGIFAHGETRIVRVVPNGEATGNPDGASWATAYGDIKAAYESLGAEGGEVWIKKGLYVLSNAVEMAANVSVYGGFAGTETSRAEADPEANMTLITGDQELNDGYMSGSPRSWRYNIYQKMWDYETLTFNVPVPDYGWSDKYGANYDHYFWTPWPNKSGVSGLTTSEANNQNVLNGLPETGCAFCHPADGEALGQVTFEGLVFSGFKTNVISAVGQPLSSDPWESRLSVRKCRFLGCITGLAGVNGWAFAPVRVSDMPVTVADCEFNRCLNGVTIAGNSLMISNEVAFVVTNCTFEYCTPAGAATVNISCKTHPTAAESPLFLVTGCTFAHNYPLSYTSAGVAAQANGVIEKCVFRDHRTHDWGPNLVTFYGGDNNSAVNRLEVRDCRFENNVVDDAKTSGTCVGIFCSLRDATFSAMQNKMPIIRNCSFIGNRIRLSNGSKAADYAVVALQGGLHANQSSSSAMFFNCTVLSNAIEYVGNDASVLAHLAMFNGRHFLVNCVVKDSQFVSTSTGGVPQFYEMMACSKAPTLVNTVIYNETTATNYHALGSVFLCYNSLVAGETGARKDSAGRPISGDFAGVTFTKLKQSAAGVPMIGVKTPDRRPGRPVWDVGFSIAIYDTDYNSRKPWRLFSDYRLDYSGCVAAAPSILNGGVSDTEHLIPDANGQARKNKIGKGVYTSDFDTYGPLCAPRDGFELIVW